MTLRDDWDINDLVAYLHRSQRSRVTVLLSVPQRQVKPPVDGNALKRRLGAKADVVVVPAALTYKLTDTLGRRQSAFGGAARVYPCDDEWLSDHYQIELIQPKSSLKAMLTAIEQAVDDEIERTEERAQQHRNEIERRKAIEEQRRREQETQSAVQEPQAPAVPTSASKQSAKQLSKHAKSAKHSTSTIRLNLPQNDAGVFAADTADRAATLAEYLRSPQSTMPVVIATRNVGMTASLADTEELAKMLRDAAYVVDVIGPEATAELNARMPKGAQTFGNACRVIPAGSEWITHGGVKLFWGWNLGERARVTDAVLQEAARLSFNNTYSTHATTDSRRTVSGTVLGSPAEGRVLVDLGRGSYATILTNLVSKDVPGDRLFAKSMAVSGLFDEESRRLDLTEPRPRRPREALSSYASGMVVPAQVAAVRRGSCTLKLFPGAMVEVPAEDAGVGTDLRWELTVGTVVPVAVIERDDGDAAWSDVDTQGDVRLHWLMSLLDVDKPPVPAPSYFPGGPAWIAIPDPTTLLAQQTTHHELSAFDEQQLSTLIPDSADTASAQRIRDLYAQLMQTRQELTTAEHQRSAATAQLEQAKRHALEQRRTMRQQSKHRDVVSEVDLQDRFADPRQQLDFEVYMAWVTRIPAAEKENKPLKRNWGYGPDFFASLEAVQGVDREKVAHVMLEVVLGLDKELNSRGLHQLRTGEGGADPKRRTAAGDTYWRVYLQTNTPGARRLHYVRRADGSVVFTRVGLHDDFRS